MDKVLVVIDHDPLFLSSEIDEQTAYVDDGVSRMSQSPITAMHMSHLIISTHVYCSLLCDTCSPYEVLAITSECVNVQFLSVGTLSNW